MTVDAWTRTKAALRNTRLYQPIFRFRQFEQEREYMAITDASYRRAPQAFAEPGVLDRSKQLLDRSWTGPRHPKGAATDVHVMLIDRPGANGPWFEPELDRSFDLDCFSMARHYRGYHKGDRDLIPASMGVDPNDFLTWYSPNETSQFHGWRSQLQVDAIEAVRQVHSRKPIDLCFVYGSHREFEADTLRRIHALGVPVCLYWLDEKHAHRERPDSVPNGITPLIGACDVHLTNTHEALRWYMAKGAAAYYFPQGIDVELFKPREIKRDIPVSFLGAAYGVRPGFIRKLRKRGIDVTCFGPGWEHGPAPDAFEVFCRSVINLGIGATGNSERLTCVKGRDFDVSATGSLHLTTYDYELARLFRVGREVACYRNEIDCAEQIRYFLERPDEAAAIGEAARQRCVNEHNWTNRLTGLLRWMGILVDQPGAGPAA